MNPAPPTYPLRPVNGGPLEKARPKHGLWYYEPKYNGWRALVHLPSGTMFNRKGRRLSVETEFQPALRSLCATLDAQAFKWVDCEGLERRHGLGRGSLVVFDVVPEPAQRTAPFTQRRAWLEAVLPVLSIWNDQPAAGQVWLSSHEGRTSPYGLWQELKTLNGRFGCEFYEGVVAKRADSLYPLQLRSPDVEFPFWMKHRWAW